MKKTLALVLSALMVMSCIATIFTFNVSAADVDLFAWATEWTTVDGTAKDAVYQESKVVPSDEQFKYDYALAYDNGNYYFGVKFVGTLSGSATSYGNGNGTNLRLWLRDPSTGYVSYNYFLDVSYDGTGFKTMCKKNTNANGNTGVSVNTYTDAAPYTVSGKTTSTGCEILVVVPESVIGNPYQIQAVFSVSNKKLSNYCLHSSGETTSPHAVWAKTFATVDLGGIALDNYGDYVGGKFTIMTRVGTATTIGEVSAITYGQAKDYNYFNLVLCNANGVVVDVNQTLGRPAGVKTDIVIPEGGFALLFNENKTDDKAAFKAIKKGDYVIVRGADLKALATASVKKDLVGAGIVTYATFTAEDTPAYATTENLATKKTTKITLDKVDATGTYTGNIADGVTGPTGYTNKWRGFRAGGNVVFDFGEIITNIGSVDIYNWPANKSGITKPSEIKVEASFDGETWTQLYGTTDFSAAKWASTADAVMLETIKFDKLVAARYIRVTISGKWVFVSEVEVNAYTEIPTTALTTGYAYATDSANIITWNMGSTIDEVNPACKNHEWWSLARCEWDAKQGAFIVTDVTIGTDSKTTSDFGDYAIPRFGFVLAAHHAGSGAATELANFIKGLKKGDKVYVADIDLANIKATDKLTGVVSTEVLANSFKIDTKQLLTSVGFAGGDVTIFVPFDGKTTIGDIAAAVREVTKGDDTDYNYYGLITVDKDNKVAAIYNSLGRPAGNKNDVAIPEGGYALAINATAFNGVYVGDQVCLYNVDLKALAGKGGTLTDAYFAILHSHEYKANVVAKDCLNDGYTEHVCVCGAETEHTDIVKTTGHDVEGVTVQTKDPTCVDGGYDYQICKECKEEIIVAGTETKATGKHDYSDEKVGNAHKHVCSVCQDTYYTNAKGVKSLDILVSHNNAYNWATFQAEFVSTAGKTTKDINASTTKWNQLYVLESIDGSYVVTKQYQNVDEVITTKCPEGGLLLLINQNNAAYKFTSNAHGYSLLGYTIIIPDGMLSAQFAIDTTKNPQLAKHVYALEPAVVSADIVAFNKDGVIEADAMTYTGTDADKFGIEVNINTAEIAYNKFETVVSFDPNVFEYLGTQCPGLEGSGAEIKVIESKINEEFYTVGKIIITVKCEEASTDYIANIAKLYFRLRGNVSTNAAIELEKTSIDAGTEDEIPTESGKFEIKLNGGDPIKSLGAQFNAEKVALRFGASYTRIDGKKVVDMGMYLVSEKALGDKDITVANVIASAKAIRVSATGIDAASYVEGKAFDDYASFNFTVAVTGLTGHEKDNIVAVPYVILEGDEIAYGDPIVRNYNDVAGIK